MIEKLLKEPAVIEALIAVFVLLIAWIDPSDKMAGVIIKLGEALRSKK